ncbi:MAG: endopeptidase La, partial [Tenericutes bacterium]|nr:endopeptidase La [Mycoplasmatota bacterium]
TKESIEVAVSYIKSNSIYFEIEEDFFNKNDIHIHFTEGATHKDGPSAGIAIVTAILSSIKNKTISSEISMTGEITLKGDILKVGGIKEKSIASVRNKINKLYISEENKSDILWLDNCLKDSIKYIFVDNYKKIYEEIFL